MISVSDAIMQTITGKGRVFDIDYIPESFRQYTVAYNKSHHKHKIFKEIDDFKHYGITKEDRFTHVKLGDVKTQLVSIHWKTFSGFYGGVPARRYGQWARMNEERMRYLYQLNPLDDKVLVDVASGHRWELMLDGRSGYYIHQHHLNNQNLIEIIHTNYEIAHTMGRLAKINV